LRRLASLWLPAGAWTALLLLGSTRPGHEIPGFVPDWLTHGTAYLVLGLLLARALASGLGRPLSGRRAAAVVVLAVMVGLTDEAIQSRTPGRDPSLGDIGKDAAGATLAALLWRSRTREVPPA
jgi:VanZ family protein